MRQMICLLAACILAACATPAADTTTAAAPAPETPAYPSLVAQLLASAGRADAPNRAEIDRALGAPDIERREGAGLALTYRLDTCALLLLMTADARNEMRLAEAHASARRPGEASPSLEQCAAEAAQRAG